MKRLSLYVYLVLMFSLFTSHSFAAKKHKIYKTLPCNFNGVEVGPSAQIHDGIKGGKCCPNCSAYKRKRGTSMNVKRGTPVVAITDMKVVSIEDSGAEQKSAKGSKSMGKKHGIDHYQTGSTMKPYDDVKIYFIDKKAIENRNIVEFEMVSSFDLANVGAPKKLVTRDDFAGVGTFVNF